MGIIITKSQLIRKSANLFLMNNAHQLFYNVGMMWQKIVINGTNLKAFHRNKSLFELGIMITRPARVGFKGIKPVVMILRN